jgi:hypothetical protein
MQMLCFMALAGGAALDELFHASCVLWHEGATQPQEGLLDTHMSHAVGVLQDGRVVAV